MITRDNKESISGTAQNARQRFGEVLKHYRIERDLAVREVARRCKVPVGAVEKWEAGEQLPNSDEWKALCRGIAHALMKFDDLYKRARTEAETDARTRAQTNMKEQKTVQDTRPNNPSVKIGTSLAEKLTAAIEPAPKVPAETLVTPQPKLEVVQAQQPRPDSATAQLGLPERGYAADGRRLMPVVPRGSKEAVQIERRKQFVRELISARPKIRTSGADSVLEAVRKAFGIGLSPETIEEIRADLEREKIKTEILREMPPPTPPTLPAMAAQLVEHVTQAAPAIPQPSKPHDPEGELRAAVQLILGAIPNLQTFTIAIDEHGEASVDYQIRKVVITTEGGSLKVKR